VTPTPDSQGTPLDRLEMFYLGPNSAGAMERLSQLIGRTLERIEVVPLGVMFHFSGGLVYWAIGGPR